MFSSKPELRGRLELDALARECKGIGLYTGRTNGRLLTRLIRGLDVGCEVIS